MRALSTAALLAACLGCGYVGPPQPPALNIPQAVSDLRVAEIGDKIVVRFTPPARTTEELPVAKLTAIDLYVGPGEAEFSRDRWAAGARRYQVPLTQSGDFGTELPASDWVGQQIVLAVRASGSTGRQSDWSNYGYLTVAPPLTTPSPPALVTSADGVALTWTGNAPRYRILRTILTAPDAPQQAIAEVDTASYFDATTAFGARYRYSVVGLGGESHQSLPSPPSEIAPTDVFAPAVPTGLTATAGAGSIDLLWTRNAEEDLAGYNVFRALDDGPFERIAERVTVPAFSDTQVQSAKRYRYAVSAIDASGNESARSVEASASVE